MYMQDVIFYTIWGCVSCMLVYLVFVVAKSGNYQKGYRQGWTDRSLNSTNRIYQDGVNNDKHK